ncbi:MAG: SelB C-terminal domain-containing protein, partial [Lachnospiraceae bacterium]|nr:SelB C-terminal domain-containing protein [Lachnospiraceae bacterium]
IDDIENEYLEAKFQPPSSDEIVDKWTEGKPKSERLQIRQILVDLAKAGRLIKLNNDYYIHKSHFDYALSETNKFFETHDKMKMSELRDILETSRKYAILIIEYMDAKHITKLVGDYRIKYNK